MMKDFLRIPLLTAALLAITIDARNEFEASVAMKVSPADSFLSATETEIQQFAQLFLDSYNSWEDFNPNVCDPLLRTLVNVTFTSRQTADSGRRHLVEDLDEDSEERDLQRRPRRPALVNFEEDDVDFLISFRGTCDGCETGSDPLFKNDVSNRRRLGQRNMQECTGSELRAPTEEEILDLFQSNIVDLTYVEDVSDLREITNATCPSNNNQFSAGSDETTFTLRGVKAFSTASAATFGKALTDITDPRVILALYDEFTQGYCDPKHRTLTRAGFGTADLDTSGGSTSVVLSFTSLDGKCRGCSDLFDDVSLVRSRNLGASTRAASPTDTSSFSHPLSQRHLQVNSEEDVCWCYSQAMQRAPTKFEFERFLTEMFNEVVTKARVFVAP